MTSGPPPIPQAPPPPLPVPPAGYQPQFGSPEPPKKGWMGRNWFWALPCGCVCIIMLCIGGCVAMGAFGLSQFAKMEPIKTAVEKAQKDPQVQAELGTPIETGWAVQGKVNVVNSSGTANMSVPLKGPKGSGTLNIIATMTNGVWKFTTLEVDVDGKTKPISLLKQDERKPE